MDPGDGADPVRQAMGADLNTLIHLRNARLLELQQAPAHEIDAMLQAMKSACRLPKLGYHFERHGKDFAAVSPDDLNAFCCACPKG